MPAEMHIIQLLDRSGNCILPGLGNIRAVPHKAYIHPVAHMFSPPSAAFYFFEDPNANLDACHFDLHSAAFLTDFANRLKNELLIHGQADIPSVGVLKKTNYGKTTLDQTANSLPRFFGLSTFSMPALLREQQTITHTEDFSTHTKHWQNQKLQDRKRKKRSFLVPGIVMLLFLSVVAAMALFVYPGLLYKPDISFLILKPSEHLAVIENPAVKTEVNDTEPKPELPSAVKQQLAEAQELPASQGERMYIILGSFKKNENALALLNKLEDSTAKLFSGPDGFTRVGIEANADSAEAFSRLAAYQQQYKGAWMLPVNK